MIVTHIVCSVAVAYLLFSQRVFLIVDTGGRGILPLLDLLVLSVFGFLVLFSGTKVFLFLRSQSFWLYWAPFITLSIMLPVVGFVLDYPLRTAFSSLQAFLAFSFISIGFWLYSNHYRFDVFKNYIFWAIIVQFLYAALQFIYRSGVIELSVLESMINWDIVTQRAYSDDYVLVGRSVGLYINPNILGFWSVLSFWFSYLLLKGNRRLTGVAASLVTLLLSNSRGALFALLFGSLILSAYRMLVNLVYDRLSFNRFTLLLVVLIILLAPFTVLLLGEQSHLQRLAQGLSVLTQGMIADPNLEGRVIAWQNAITFFSYHPLGTFGPPELMFGGFLDNEYVRVLLQGGIVYLLSFILLILGGVICLRKQNHICILLSVFTAVTAVMAITATVFSFPPIALYWLLLGMLLGEYRYSTRMARIPFVVG